MIAQFSLGSVPTNVNDSGVEIASNRTWETLPGDRDTKTILEAAAKKIGIRQFRLAGALINRRTLQNIRRRFSNDNELHRPFREHLGLPIDASDFLLFLDDFLAIDPRLLFKHPVDLSASLLRNAGIFMHPDDIFFKKPRLYGATQNRITLTSTRRKRVFRPAVDGSHIGPSWVLRFQQPATEAKRISALYLKNPDFGNRVRSLVSQLKEQGAFVMVESTVRDRRRGFLLYASYVLSRAENERELAATVKRLNQLRDSWNLDIDIKFNHQTSWQKTVSAARDLANEFGVTFATIGGARNSSHYDGKAVDIYAISLPRVLTLRAPNGKTRRFDLYEDDQTRDLNLTPELIEWIEKNFNFRKLRKDYPHWSDSSRSR